MEKQDIKFLKDIIDAPSPSGYEMPAAKVIRERMEQTADSVTTDVMGNVHALLKGNADGPSVMLAGHIDEIGFQVRYISDDGFLYFGNVGGIDTGIMPGIRVNVWTSDGALPGVLASKSVHLMTLDERKKLADRDKLYIDLGMSGEDVKKVVRIGDPITFDSSLIELGDDLLASRALDDKAGIYIAIRVMEEVKKAGGAVGDLIIVGTVQEEIGTRGAETATFGANPTIGIAVDTGTATDYPDVNKQKHGEFNLGDGPSITRGPNINPVLFDKMVAAAQKADAKYQIAAAPGVTGTDARTIQLSRDGKVAGLVSLPLRYLHTPNEVGSKSDIDAAIAILTQLIVDLKEDEDFTPMA